MSDEDKLFVEIMQSAMIPKEAFGEPEPTSHSAVKIAAERFNRLIGVTAPIVAPDWQMRMMAEQETAKTVLLQVCSETESEELRAIAWEKAIHGLDSNHRAMLRYFDIAYNVLAGGGTFEQALVKVSEAQ